MPQLTLLSPQILTSLVSTRKLRLENLYVVIDLIFINTAGIGLVCISVIADAFLPNFQERVFEHGSSRIEVTYFTNILCLTAMTVSFSITGENFMRTCFCWTFAVSQFVFNHTPRNSNSFRTTLLLLFYNFIGDLQTAFSYALSNPHALTLMVIYTFLAYIAITFHMALVQEFGGITTGNKSCN